MLKPTCQIGVLEVKLVRSAKPGALNLTHVVSLCYLCRTCMHNTVKDPDHTDILENLAGKSIPVQNRITFGAQSYQG